MKALSIHSTLCLNPSNHPAVPPEGLVLEAGKPTPVPSELRDYLISLGVEIQDDPTPKPAPRLAPKE